MCPVLLHREKVPGETGKLAVEVLNQRRGRREADCRAVAVAEVPDALKVGIGALQRLDQIDESVEPLTSADKVGGLFAKRALGKRGHMPAEQNHWQLRGTFLEGAAYVACRRHHLRRGGRLLAIGDHCAER